MAIEGLDAAILKSATLADSPAARPLAPMLFQVAQRPPFPPPPPPPAHLHALTSEQPSSVQGSIGSITVALM